MKNAIIFGDSYSTFDGYVPHGYATYYSSKERPETDVTEVQQTWWHQVANDADINILLNDSWSGSTIGYTGYNNSDCSRSSSFIYRLKRLADSGFFKSNDVNTVFVFGGTNDSWSNAPLGEEKTAPYSEEDLYFVLPAISYFLQLLKETLPEADVYCLINTDIKEEIRARMKNACIEFGIRPVSFDLIDKRCGHPTIQGMCDIKTSVLNAIN